MIFGPGIKILFLLILIGIGAAIGWTTQGWNKDRVIDNRDKQIAQMEVDIAKAKAASAEVRSMAADAALSNIERAAYVMRSAVDAYKLDQQGITTTLSALSQQIKSIKVEKPLPVDCKPDTERVQNLRKSIDATNSAIKR